MPTVGQGRSPIIEIDVGSSTWPVIFTANGEYLVSGSGKEVQVWRVRDWERLVTKKVWHLNAVHSLAVGAQDGMFVWDAETYEEVFSINDYFDIFGLDFSPGDSTQLLTSSNINRTATVWDFTTLGIQVVVQVGTDGSLFAAKYSSQGDRIATATSECVQVWDSTDGHLLVLIHARVTPWYNTGLLCFNNHLFVVSGGTIKGFEASTGSAVSEWPAPRSGLYSCIVSSMYGEFVAHCAKRTVTFWDTSTRTQVALIQHPQLILSIALSPDGQCIAIRGQNGKVTIKSLSRVTVSILPCSIRTTFFYPSSFIQPHSLVYAPLSRNLTSKLTTLHSTRGNTISSQMRRRY